MDKTNVMRILDSKKIPYTPYEYSADLTEGVKIAQVLSQPCEKVFKTLVTQGADGSHFVFCIPVAMTLDLKAAARAVGVKSVSMLKQKDLLPLTGYIHGGCSPVGMKKPFRTVIHFTAQTLDSFFVSAGKVGRQVCVNPLQLAQLVGADFADIAKESE